MLLVVLCFLYFAGSVHDKFFYYNLSVSLLSPDMESHPHRQIKKTMTEPLLDAAGTQQGGFRTLAFILANEAFEKLATYGLMPNMISYLMKEYHLKMVDGSNILFFWSATSSFLPIVGAVVADSKVGRFRMIGFGSIVSLLGMTLLWLTTMIPYLRPPPCHQSSTTTCAPPTAPQLLFLFFSFVLMSIGGAGIRSSSLAFGAEQLERNNSLKRSGTLESYFSWYYATAMSSIVIAVTCIVFLQEHLGWKVGFGVPVLLMLFSVISFFLASAWYIKVPVKSSVFTSFHQVLVASYRNRRLPTTTADTVYHSKQGSMLVIPSEKLRFFNKACIAIEDSASSSAPDQCTVDQVEELKALIKIIPMWSTAIVLSISVSQHSFPFLQASSMERHLTPSFEIPAASMSVFVIITLTTWLALYDRVILPTASKIMKRPVRLCPKTRMGIGLFLIFASMIVVSTVESLRRQRAAVGATMSVMWLIPQNCLIGLAEAFNAIGQNEFYFSELPRSMSGIATTLAGVGVSVANVMGSLIMSLVDDVTGGDDGRESWVSSDINEGHYDYYFLVLAGLCLVNIVYFLVCSRAYGPCVGEKGGVASGGKEELEDE